MEFPFQKEQLASLEMFLAYVKTNPSILHDSRLNFFKQFIIDCGGKVPSPPENENSNATHASTESKEPEPEPEPESEESDIELDMSGVIEADTDAPQKMGDPDKVPTEAEVEESQAKRSEAASAFVENNYEKAVESYTAAIELNPQAALLYAKRGQVYLSLKKPNAAIRDCNRALELNPDSAAAHKFRGRAYQLLGQWEEAAVDLRLACKYDFDEQANEWLKEVTPNAQKIEEHKRKKERKQMDRKVMEHLERLKRAREASAKVQEENAPGAAPTEGFPGGLGNDMGQFLNDPDILAAFKDPEVIMAFNDISSNPANIFKYQNNPKVMSLVNKMTSKFGGASGMAGMANMMGGFGGMGGMGGMPGANRPSSEPPKPSPNDDVGLD